MTDLLENILKADENMNNAKEGIEQKIRTERLTRSKVLSEYEKAKKMELITISEKISTMRFNLLI